jgi:stage V sporulation protein R
MTKKALDSSEIVDYGNFHSGTASQSPGKLNPYALGLSLLLDIEERWNKGRHGEEYDDCDNVEKKRNWDTGEMKGLEKVFEVRKRYSDISFIDEFLTPEFCAKSKLFTFSKHESEWGTIWTIDSRQFKEIKEKLLFNLTNLGSPFIYITDANYENRGELLLHHKWEGIPLDLNYAESTLINLEKLWQRPVNLETYIENEWYLISCYSEDVEYSALDDDISYKY